MNIPFRLVGIHRSRIRLSARSSNAGHSQHDEDLHYRLEMHTHQQRVVESGKCTITSKPPFTGLAACLPHFLCSVAHLSSLNSKISPPFFGFSTHLCVTHLLHANLQAVEEKIQTRSLRVAATSGSHVPWPAVIQHVGNSV